MLLPPLFRDHPRPADKRRLMAHMLTMPAGKISHPVSMLILMIATNRLIHSQYVFTELVLSARFQGKHQRTL